MNTFKKIVNVFGIIFAVMMSIVLFVMLIVSPVVSAASSITKPQRIREILITVDFMEKIEFDEGKTLEETLEEEGVSDAAIDDLMESDTAIKILDLCQKDIEAALNGDFDAEHLTAEAIEEIVDDHIDDIAEIIKEHDTKDKSIKEIKKDVRDIVEKNSEQFADQMGKISKTIVGDIHEEERVIIRNVTNGTYFLYLLGAIIILSLIVYGLRFPRFKGFVWLTVVYGISACFIGLLLNPASFVGDKIIDIVLDALGNIDSDFIVPVLEVILSKTYVFAIIFGVFAVLFLLAFVFLRFILPIIKKNKKSEPTEMSNTPAYVPASPISATDEAVPTSVETVPTPAEATPMVNTEPEQTVSAENQ